MGQGVAFILLLLPVKYSHTHKRQEEEQHNHSADDPTDDGSNIRRVIIARVSCRVTVTQEVCTGDTCVLRAACAVEFVWQVGTGASVQTGRGAAAGEVDTTASTLEAEHIIACEEQAMEYSIQATD